MSPSRYHLAAIRALGRAREYLVAAHSLYPDGLFYELQASLERERASRFHEKAKALLREEDERDNTPCCSGMLTGGPSGCWCSDPALRASYQGD